MVDWSARNNEPHERAVAKIVQGNSARARSAFRRMHQTGWAALVAEEPVFLFIPGVALLVFPLVSAAIHDKNHSKFN
ncbi:hypothetical protein [Bradyrhizobium elkanii]|jgi:hypothetical protein|uniref:hypothetical protein n=1 Tax=Bradyrhizobium elkanii TaxID=29448 RepID=UPI0012FD180B|nr:hypothetical protein [Bradyrhizobium elkanii]WLA84051.1 hypothetical protein QNJ99_07135 [Bradyrhizobium elkanii]